MAAGAASILIVILIVLMARGAQTTLALEQTRAGLEDQVAARTGDIRDEIEERLLAERALKESEERLRGFAEASSDWFWEMDEQCRFSYFSNRFTEVTGVPQEALLGKTREETGIPDVDPEQWEKHLEDLAARRSFRDFEHPRKLSEGRTVYLCINGRAMFAEDGRFTGYRGTGSDITEKKSAENIIRSANQELERRVEERTQELRRLNEQLREEDAKLREILENSPVGVAIVPHNTDGSGLSGDRLFVNSAMIQMFGATDRQSFLKTRIEDSWFDIEDWKIFEDKVRRGEEILNFEVQRRRVDGSTWWTALSTRAIHFNDQECTMVWHFDITERKRSAMMKDEFISMVSHELRTPLTSIVGTLGLLAGGAVGDISGDAQRLIEIAKNNCDHLARLTNDILDLERIESGNMPVRLEPVRLLSALDDILTENRELAESYGVAFALTSVGADVVVAADADRLAQVMTNLLSNAAKFSPRGSRVEVSTRRMDNFMRIKVRDSGPGVPEEFKERIFDKFSQADASSSRRHEGSGLGLSIVKALVEGMGGSIGFSSAPGSGATFYFDLPM